MNHLRSVRLTSIAAAIATVALFPRPAMAVTATNKVALTHAQLVAALSAVRSATAAAEQPGWRQVRDITPGADFDSWTTVTRFDEATGRLATGSTVHSLRQATSPSSSTFRKSEITLPHIGSWIGNRQGDGDFMAAGQALLDLLGRPHARYALWLNTWDLFIRAGKHQALSQLVGGLLQLNATGTVAHNSDGTSTYTVSARYSDEESGARLPATVVLHVSDSNVVTDVVVRTQKGLGVPVAIVRHLTETFGPQTIVRPRAAETVLQTDVALATEDRSLPGDIHFLANGVAAAVNRDAAATHHNAAPADIRSVARLHVTYLDEMTPIAVVAVSGGARLSVVTPVTHKRLVFVVRSVRGRAVVS
jgi:hypothetical protein